jgi:hypothetical protein
MMGALMLTQVLWGLMVPQAEPPPPIAAWEPDKTWVTIASVMKWKDPGLEDFDTRRRKDLVLDERFASRGVPNDQRALLIDNDATKHTVVHAVLRQVQRAPAGSTFIFYFQGHGVFDEAHRFVMTTTETLVADASNTGLTLSDLFAVYSLRGSRDRIILLGDACYSGHLGDLAVALTALGIPTLALTSADARAESSENWTFTQALIDALEGRTLVDKDGDGDILLSELAEEARLAMRHREGQPIGFSRPRPEFQDLRLGPARPLLDPVNGPGLDTLEPRGAHFGRGDWVLATRLAGERSVARVLGAKTEDGKPTRLRVEYYDFTDRLYAWAREDLVDPILFEEWPVGADLRVLDDGEAHRATVKVADKGLHLVSYVGYAATEDEYVAPDQILGPWDAAQERERVLVSRGATLQEAVVKGHFLDRVCVRFRGSSWLDDRCVQASRVRKLRPGGNP